MRHVISIYHVQVSCLLNRLVLLSSNSNSPYLHRWMRGAAKKYVWRGDNWRRTAARRRPFAPHFRSHPIPSGSSHGTALWLLAVHVRSRFVRLLGTNEHQKYLRSYVSLFHLMWQTEMLNLLCRIIGIFALDHNYNRSSCVSIVFICRIIRISLCTNRRPFDKNTLSSCVIDNCLLTVCCNDHG